MSASLYGEVVAPVKQASGDTKLPTYTETDPGKMLPVCLKLHIDMWYP